MNFEVLNQTEQAFIEIRLLYASFNINPSEGVDLLYDDPTIIERQKDIQDTRDYVKLYPPTRPSKIISFRFRRLPDERQPRSGQDLENWLYDNRLNPLLQHWSTELKHELSVIDSNNRTIRLQGYKQLLDKLSKDITDFEGKTVDTFPELITDKTADWSDIFKILNDYLPVVERAINKYDDLIDEYLPATKEQTTLTPPRQTMNNTNITDYESFSDLFTDNTRLTFCINALRNIDYPTINDEGEWIGGAKRKYIIVAWIESLEQRALIKHVDDRKQLVKLLNTYFPNLNMGKDARTFGNSLGDYYDAKAEFSSLLVQ